ncbi:hypothetical protein XPA_010556 [Xanthoria parietina]
MDNLIQSLQIMKDIIGLEVCENHIGSLVEHESQSLRDLYAPAQWRGIGDPDVVSISNKNWMDYCNGGDLVTFMEYHTNAETPTGINRATPDLPPPENWQPIIHRDIKPNNISLKLSSHSPSYSTPANSNQIYPTLILGDFGLTTTSNTAAADATTYFIGTPRLPTPSNILPFHKT